MGNGKERKTALNSEKHKGMGTQSAHFWEMKKPLLGLTHFMGRKMLESQSRQGNYVKIIKMARTLGNKGIIPFRRKSHWLSIFEPIFYCFFV